MLAETRRPWEEPIVAQDLDALLRFTHDLDNLDAEDEIYQAAVGRARRLFQADTATYMGLDEQRGVLSLVASDPVGPFRQNARSPIGFDGPIASCSMAQCPIVQGKDEFPCRQAADRFGTHWAIAGSVMERGRTIGSLCVWSFSGQRWSPDDAQFLSLMADEVSRHVTRRRLASMTAEAAALRERNRLKDMFLSLCSHELRSPLTAILSASELLLSSPDAPEVERREYASVIRRQGDRLAAIVDDMLDAVRLQSGGMTIRPETVALGAVIQRVLPEIVERSPVHTGNIEIVGDDRAWADPRRVEQVLANLIGNAVKYSPKGGIVTVRVRSDKPDGQAIVDVADQGIGIPREALGRLFNPFERVPRPENADIPGTGLGLYLVKELLTHMGGGIRVESEPGKGSTFSFSLPRTQPAP